MRRNIMGDILKEAIADAKAVRETALQNAKMALEEAFTPQLKSMLSAKLKEEEDEIGDEEEVSLEDEEFGAEEIPAEEVPAEDEEFGDEVPVETYEDGEEFGGEEEVPAEEIPVEDEEFGDEDELDLEAVIKELESELSESDDAYDENAPTDDSLTDTMGEGEEKDEEDVEEPVSEGEEDGEEEETVDEQDDAYDENVEGKKDPEHVGDEDTGVAGTPMIKAEALAAELKEYKEAVVFLKDKLHEVNILNAKLLFTNKLFKEYALDNGQKLKVVETFDRAQTTREIKLVYSTLAEQFGDNGSINKRNSISESASSSVGSTKPSKESRKVITEESQVANRFKKLAGLIK